MYMLLTWLFSSPLCTCMFGHHAFILHAFIQHVDINECELETYPCHFNASCTDTEGSFNCTCNEGFEGNGFNCTGIVCTSIIKYIHMYKCLCQCPLLCNMNFTDIPECERGLDNCDPKATCTNTFGSYVCICNTGFIGDGVMCTG